MDNNVYLGYHYVRDESAPGPNCAPKRLCDQISVLQGKGYEFLTCGEVALRLKEKRPLPEKHATLSFDDGLKDQFTTAFPILEKFGVPATFFYITCALDGKLPPVIGFQIAINRLGAERIEKEVLPALLHEYDLWSYRRLLDRTRFDHSEMKMGELPEFRLIKTVFNHFLSPSLQAELIGKIFDRHVSESMTDLARDWFMNADELSQMASYGMEIAGHSVKHPWFSMIGKEEIELEARLSRAALTDVTGKEATSFAWTFGLTTPRGEAKEAVARAGYSSAWNFWTKPGDVRGSEFYGDLFDIPRFNEAFMDVEPV